MEAPNDERIHVYLQRLEEHITRLRSLDLSASAGLEDALEENRQLVGMMMMLRHALGRLDAQGSLPDRPAERNARPRGPHLPSLNWSEGRR